MLTGVNRLKTTGRHGSQVEDAIPPTSTGAVASSQGARGGGLWTLLALNGRHLGYVAEEEESSDRNTSGFVSRV